MGKDPRLNGAPARTARDPLCACLDAYLKALANRDPGGLDWAPIVRNSENNVALRVGDGLWNTITGLGEYDLRFADVETGQVGLFTTVHESFNHSAMTLRLGVVDGRIAEVEALVVRQADSGLKFEPQTFEHKPVMNEILDQSARVPRERMIALSDGYFDTLQLNDGTILTKFHASCERVENGLRTTNNPEFIVPVAHLGCEEQFRLGNYRYDDRLRGRRYPLVDEERGLVLAAGFIDHSGRLGDYMLTDGTAVTSPIRHPHSFYMLEMFKLKDGAIEQIEANFITVPYNMPSPWDDWAKLS